MSKILFAFITILLAFWMPSTVHAGDSHAGYYYPAPQSSEVYASSQNTLLNATKLSRIGFTSGMMKQQLARGYAPQFYIFAKGASAKKLIIITTGRDSLNTLYRLRALLAGLTSQARLTPFFQETENAADLNFFDLAHLLGVVQITVSDGDELAHRINLR